jgi:hypothetical protein
MEFHIEIETTGANTGRPKELSILADSDNNRLFVAYGNEPGNYQLTAWAFKFKSFEVSQYD